MKINTDNNKKTNLINEMNDRVKIIDDITGEEFYPENSGEVFRLFEKLSNKTRHPMTLFMPAEVVNSGR